MLEGFKEYIAYLKNNPEGYWFKRKAFGWGWTPVKWQGWVVVGAYIAVLLFLALTIDENSPPRELAFTFLIPAVFITIVFIRICYKKGEKPKWTWGFPKDEHKK